MKRWRVARQIAKQGFNQAIVLPNSIKAALVPWFAGIKQRTGWLGEQRYGLLNDIRRMNKQRWPMTVQRFIALGNSAYATPLSRDSLPAPALKVDGASVQQLCSRLQLNHNKQILALCPGAEFGASKQWPAKHYCELAEYYLKQGWQVWLLGSDNDRDICAQINRDINQHGQNLAGQTSLPEVVDLLSCADLVISNDSGLMHIAAALSVPLIAVYGSTDPTHTPPLSDNHKIAWLNLECSPCFKRVCPLEHLNCLNQLSAQTVITYSKKLLETQAIKPQ
jgi:heptosyltransferase-2